MAITRIRARLLFLATAVCFSAAPAGPASAAEVAPPAVVYTGLPASADAAGRVASLMALLDPPVHLDAPPVHLSTRLTTGELAAFGSPGSVCDAEHRDGAAYQRELDELYRATLMADDVAPLIRRAVGLQACLTEPVEPRALARVDFVEAVLAFAEGEEERAREAFTRVFAIDPHHPWDDEFPPDAQILFAQVATDVVRAVHAPLQVLASPDDQVWIDGLHAGNGLAAADLAPGRHLIQVIPAGGDRALSLSVVTGDTVQTLVVTPEVANRGDLSEDESALLASALAADERGGPVHLIAVADPSLWVWRVAAGDTQAEQLATPPVAHSVVAGLVNLSPRRIRDRRVAAGVLLGTGAGLAVAGALMAGISSDEVQTLQAGVESGELGPFPCEGHPDPESFELYQSWQGAGDRVRVGVGMLIAGGTLMGVSIPVGAMGAGRRHEVSLGGYLVPDLRRGASSAGSPTPWVVPLVGGVQIRIRGSEVER